MSIPIVVIPNPNQTKVTVYFMHTTDTKIVFERIDILKQKNNEMHLNINGILHGFIPIQLFCQDSRESVTATNTYNHDYDTFRIYFFENPFTNHWKLIWKHIKKYAKYCIHDKTVHLNSNCNLFDSPPYNAFVRDLYCAGCDALIDIEWIPNYNLNSFKKDLLWEMWNSNAMNLLIEWFPEEVLEDINCF
jgi:hypothetical protein